MDTGHLLEGLVQNEDVGEKTAMKSWNLFRGKKNETVQAHLADDR